MRFVPLDVTSDESVAAATELVAETTGGTLDVLINNAGVIGTRAAPLETGPEDFIACFGVNLLGPVRVTRAMVPLMAGSENPRIVMVSSGLGFAGRHHGSRAPRVAHRVARVPLVKGCPQHGHHPVRQGAARVPHQHGRSRATRRPTSTTTPASRPSKKAQR